MDGIRQDTWPCVPVAFWHDWMNVMNKQPPAVGVVGEVFDGDPGMIHFFERSHTTHDGIRTNVDCLFDFPLSYPIREAFIGGKPAKGVAQMLQRDQRFDNVTRPCRSSARTTCRAS